MIDFFVNDYFKRLSVMTKKNATRPRINLNSQRMK